MYQCMECERKFATKRAAESAAENGCPNCEGDTIDLVENLAPSPTTESMEWEERVVRGILVVPRLVC